MPPWCSTSRRGWPTDHDGWWQRLTDAHERSGVGNLVRPEELYVTPDAWRERVAMTCGLDVEQLGLESSDGAELVQFSSQPTPRFHGAVPKLLEEVKKLSAAGERVVLAAGSMGELERLADIFNEYQVPYRLGTRGRRRPASARRPPTSTTRARRPRWCRAMCPREWRCPTPSWCSSAPTISSTIPRRARRGSPGSAPRPRRFCPTSATSRWAIT